MTTPKITLYSLSDLKTTLDDHLPLYLTSPKLLPTSSSPLPAHHRFTASTTNTVIRLALGYTAVSVALYLFYLDYYLKIPFSQHKHIAAPATIVYFLLNAALTAWVWLGEKGMVFAGSRKEKNKGGVTTLKVFSRAPHRKYDPTYRLIVEWNSTTSVKPKEWMEVMAPFSRFFAEDGLLVPAAFEGWLRESIPEIADSKTSGVTGKGKGEGMYGVAVDQEAVMVVGSGGADSGEVSGREATAAGKRRTKRKA